MTKKRLLFITFILSCTAHSWGQEVKADAEIRSRGEYRDGFQQPLLKTEDAAYVNNLRTKLNLSYKGEDIKAKLTLLDSRIYGKTAVANTGNSLGVLEAWGEYAFTPQFSLALGRQGLEYDDKRLFSYNNWSNTPGAHDLLLLKYATEGLTVHLGSAYNNTGDSLKLPITPYTLAYKTLNFLWASKTFGKIAASAVWVNEGFEGGNVGSVSHFYRNTIGANIWLSDKKSPTTFNVNGYYQFGKDNKDKELNAYLLSAKVQQKLAAQWAAQIGGDLFSGSKTDIAASKNNTFNKLYGTNHAFNGSIEYWRNVPAQGLVDFYLGATFKRSRFSANLTYHNFSTQKEFEKGKGKGIGSEIDLTIDYTINSRLALQGGWSTYLANDGTDILKKQVNTDTRFPHWAYVQLTFKPVFFSK
ncbi:MAG: alginate export family protein [Dysgonamonadaceae bacterium]|jgi:hypothetical protein|nr:alginate export family protein [Dysgonamonadaceae bacterium]